MKHWMLYLLLVVFVMPVAVAQETQSIVYIWANRIYAQATDGGNLQELGLAFTGLEASLPDTRYDVYHHVNSPLATDDIADDFGFYHGVWSPDFEQFVYLELRSGSPDYRIQLRSADGNTRNLIASQVSAVRGYLDPLGWLPTGEILLIERYRLNQLGAFRIWRLDPDSGDLSSYFNYAGSTLTGQTAFSGSGAFLGVDVARGGGYILDFESQTVMTFPLAIQPPEPPRSVFELSHYPLAVLGIMNNGQVDQFLATISLQTVDTGAPPRPGPFLHWPLADVHRTITCYPDSNWTRANFEFVCPGLARAYNGHQGTDVSGRPNGLPLNTDVYPALPGLVIATNDRCDNTNPSCGSAYGNYVLLEHTVNVAGQAQIWLTGYAHLAMPLVEAGDYIADITQPIARSGDTGIGGAHLHFEVRNIMPNGNNRWVDPWGAYYPPHEKSLWLDGNANPRSALDYLEDDE